ncbi:MAG: DUF354 domain-containing protein [Candidatus Undinarchaeales archaeon]|jgi:hypothetical protein|nr:DUF354 domain-containing protein [Candidatus Undinarchaeales archaeon]MDP7493431.1 DUF354 domain-containing protein [Candidatus Undinarchaeales archaeon]
MRTLVDINHPAHVHFFRCAVKELRDRGHEVLITARNKECEYALLDAYGLEYTDLGTHYKGLAGKAVGMLAIDARLAKVARRFRPHVLTGIHNTYAAHVSRLTRARSVVFTDTEHARLANTITFPFAHRIVTPACFRLDLGPKHRRYRGYHELAYLRPERFTPDPVMIERTGVDPDEPFVVVRLVSWGASHDVGHRGLGQRESLRLVRALEKEARVVVTTEEAAGRELARNVVSIPPHEMHHLLAFASLYIGEGATMASEAAVLGTPALYVNPLDLGYMAEQEERYGLVHRFLEKGTTADDLLEAALPLLTEPDAQKRTAAARERLLEETEDVTEVICEHLLDTADM